MLSELDMLLQDGIFDTVGQQMNWLCQLPLILQKTCYSRLCVWLPPLYGKQNVSPTALGVLLTCKIVGFCARQHPEAAHDPSSVQRDAPMDNAAPVNPQKVWFLKYLNELILLFTTNLDLLWRWWSLNLASDGPARKVWNMLSVGLPREKILRLLLLTSQLESMLHDTLKFLLARKQAR